MILRKPWYLGLVGVHPVVRQHLVAFSVISFHIPSFFTKMTSIDPKKSEFGFLPALLLVCILFCDLLYDLRRTFRVPLLIITRLPKKHDLVDWDCAEALDIPEMVKSLEHIRKEGTFPVSHYFYLCFGSCKSCRTSPHSS